MKSRVWPYGLILAALFLFDPSFAAVFHTSAKVTVVSGVEIETFLEIPEPGILARMGIDPPRQGDAEDPVAPRRLRITGPADLSVHVALKSLQGAPLDGFQETGSETHGPAGDLLLDLGDLSGTGSSEGQPLLLYLEYE